MITLPAHAAERKRRNEKPNRHARAPHQRSRARCGTGFLFTIFKISQVSHCEIQAGTPVRVVGLKTHTKYNKKAGVAVHWIEDTGHPYVIVF